jgi:hypothetical protein
MTAPTFEPLAFVEYPAEEMGRRAAAFYAALHHAGLATTRHSWVWSPTHCTGC